RYPHCLRQLLTASPARKPYTIRSRVRERNAEGRANEGDRIGEGDGLRRGLRRGGREPRARAHQREAAIFVDLRETDDFQMRMGVWTDSRSNEHHRRRIALEQCRLA